MKGEFRRAVFARTSLGVLVLSACGARTGLEGEAEDESALSCPVTDLGLIHDLVVETGRIKAGGGRTSACDGNTAADRRFRWEAAQTGLYFFSFRPRSTPPFEYEVRLSREACDGEPVYCARSFGSYHERPMTAGESLVISISVLDPSEGGIFDLHVSAPAAP